MKWFGNIVTMKWWDNIWLNEGFASYFEYRGVAWANPDWLTVHQFLIYPYIYISVTYWSDVDLWFLQDNHHVINDIQSALRADQSVGSHPIVTEVNTPAEITSIFDTISYSKVNLLNEAFVMKFNFLDRHQWFLTKANSIDSAQSFIFPRPSALTLDPWWSYFLMYKLALFTVGCHGLYIIPTLRWPKKNPLLGYTFLTNELLGLIFYW